MQHYSSDVLDASLLLMPLVLFIAPTDPRWLSTLDAIGDELVSDSLVYRYNIEASPDGLEGDEGTFSICSFWYVEALTRAGRVDEARLAFEKMLTYANHLGLYSEEIGPTGEQLGNFPQAFTHLALISAAFNLDRTGLGGPPMRVIECNECGEHGVGRQRRGTGAPPGCAPEELSTTSRSTTKRSPTPCTSQAYDATDSCGRAVSRARCPAATVQRAAARRRRAPWRAAPAPWSSGRPGAARSPCAVTA